LILVATGTHEQGFDRLIRAMDSLVKQGLLQDVIIQTGSSSYEPQWCTWRRIYEFDEFETLLNKADLIITHGGAGSIAGALERGKPLIIVPRRKKYHEHTNDHQLELASALEKNRRAIVVHEVEELLGAIERIKVFQGHLANGANRVVEIIGEFLEAHDQYIK
jgi:UDP-N-acetylglucosamine transferase subunit ALG13